jgi:hypothetical protein
LASEGIDLSTVRGGSVLATGVKLYKVAYCCLRSHLRNYIHQNMQPLLEETPSPAGGYQYYEEMDGVIAQLIRENAQTVLENGGQIRTMPIPEEAEPSPNCLRENLDV